MPHSAPLPPAPWLYPEEAVRQRPDPGQWRVLDTDWNGGQLFLRVWAAWHRDPQRAQHLHYVAVMAQPPQLHEAITPPTDDLELTTPWVSELRSQWWGLLPGIHRLRLAQGRVLLTLLIAGPAPQQSSEALLRQQASPVDRVYWDHTTTQAPASAPADATALQHQIKAIARYCQPGSTQLVTGCGQHGLLAQCGFTPSPAAHHAPAEHMLQTWVFAPRWTQPARTPALATQLRRSATPLTCVVIGAGISGGATAHALAQRGWHVTVIDQANHPASGASGLPVGLTAPHVSPDDNTLSQLSRHGVRCTVTHAQQQLQPGDWSPSGVLEHCLDGRLGLPSHWQYDTDTDTDTDGATTANAPAQHIARLSQDWSLPASPAQRQQAHLPTGSAALWHPKAAWIRPAQLVKALLGHPNITWLGSHTVHSITRHNAPPSSPESTARWQVTDQHHQCIAQAPLIVVAAGWHSAQWLPEGVRLSPLRGQLSWGWHDEHHRDAPFAPFPVNGKGSMISGIPTSGHENTTSGAPTHAWFTGSTFERAQHTLPPTLPEQQQARQTNADKLQQLLPALAQHLTTAAPPNTTAAWQMTQTWAGVRCTSHDRLPLVGAIAPAMPGLWVCTAMGARGLTLAMLCAEILAAQLHHEPLPLERPLAQALDAMRWA